jgi:SAM-dependent methyltransferase
MVERPDVLATRAAYDTVAADYADLLATGLDAKPLDRAMLAAFAALDLADGAVGGIVAWYSIIHTPPAHLPAVLAEFHRVLAPGGHVLLAFQAGDERVHLEEAYGHAVSLDAYRLLPDSVVVLLRTAGLVTGARLLREPQAPETVPQAYLLGRAA